MQIGLILLALAFPLLELAVLIKLGQTIGFWWTVLLLIGTAIAGGWIVHRQGLSAAQRAMQSVNEGRPPLEPVIDSFMLMIAGTLIAIPGLLTDIAGLMLLIPPVRREVARWALRRMLAGADVHVETREWRSPGRDDGPDTDTETPRPPRRVPDGGTVIEGEFERVDDPKTKRPPDESKPPER